MSTDNYVRYGDVVYIGMPSASGGPYLINDELVDSDHVNMSKVAFDSAQAYVILDGTGNPTGSAIDNNGTITIREYNNSNNYWYNHDLVNELEVHNDFSPSSPNDQYLFTITAANGDAILYNTPFLLLSQYKPEYVGYDSDSPSDGIIGITSDIPSSGPNSEFIFIRAGIQATATDQPPIDPEYWQTQCCLNNNNDATQTVYCGEYNNTSNPALCSPLISAYCAIPANAADTRCPSVVASASQPSPSPSPSTPSTSPSVPPTNGSGASTETIVLWSIVGILVFLAILLVIFIIYKKAHKNK